MTEHPPNPPDPRILILGDSFVEGVGATDNQGWAQAIAMRTPCHIIGRGRIHLDTNPILSSGCAIHQDNRTNRDE